jgi:hypothetical protein
MSYRVNRAPGRLGLFSSQVGSWTRFQDETRKRLQTHSQMLQLDLKNAFQCMDRRAVVQWLYGPDLESAEARVLTLLLEKLSGNRPGLPLLNDSVFCLGNAYLTVVDVIVSKYSANFIRFVDDYRIFSDSKNHLEEVLEGISNELSATGFAVNSPKVKLGDGAEYFEAIARGKYARDKDNDGYVSAAVFEDILDPGLLYSLVRQVVSEPESFLNEGLGRLVLGAIRRMRLGDVIASVQSYPESPLKEYSEALAADTTVVSRMLDLLASYHGSPDEGWRMIWILYVLADALPLDSRVDMSKASVLDAMRSRENGDVLSRLWANNFDPRPTGLPEIEELHKLGYLEAGGRYVKLRNQ